MRKSIIKKEVCNHQLQVTFYMCGEAERWVGLRGWLVVLAKKVTGSNVLQQLIVT